jgi:polyvinyl alcohol dehydrogenase (cytochrome)
MSSHFRQTELVPALPPAIAFALALACPTLVSAQSPSGEALYTRSCATCHDTGVNRAPMRDAFRLMAPERVLAAMEGGAMTTMANGRSAPERRAIAEFLTGTSLSTPFVTTPAPSAMCRVAPVTAAPAAASATAATTRAASAAFDASAGPQWTGWGHDTSNTRFQNAAGLAAADVPNLKLKWAFAFPGDLQSYGQTTVAGGRVFVGSWGGTVYSLDAATGCVHWFYDAGAGVRSAVSHGRVTTATGARDVVFFGDARAFVHAVDAATGAPIWKVKADDFALARISGSPTVHNGRVYIGTASGEEAAGAVGTYECCRSRGSVVALEAATGRQVWKTYMADEAQPTGRNAKGAQTWGPSGASIWATPAIDTRRNAVYVTTGNAFSLPASRLSDAFVALDLDSGTILWSNQMTDKDAYTSACRLPDKTNCPANGPDFDFGASPILVNLPDGRRALVAGQKSGMVHALDPDAGGEILWQTRIGKGGTMGGVQWGSATDGTNVYVALSDIGRVMVNYSTTTDADPNQGGGMFALSLRDGKQVWYTPPGSCAGRPRCSPAQSAAVSALPGIAFSGSVDGHMRAYSTLDGKVVWDVDTVRAYETVNGVPGRGGSIDGPGPSIAGGMVFVNSGYPTAGGTPGNVLLAFSVDGK